MNEENNKDLEDLLAPLEGEDVIWHLRFLIFIDLIKKEPMFITTALKKVHELSPSQNGDNMPSSWIEKAKKFRWEERAKKYLFECSKENLKKEREIIINEKEKYISEIFELEYSERAKRLKTTIKLSNSFLILANTLEETAIKFQSEWVDQLGNIKDFSVVLKQIGEAIAKVASYQPEEFQSGKSMNTESNIEFEIE